MIDAIYNAGLNLLSFGWWTGIVWPVLWILIKIVCILAPLMGAVAYLTLWERKLLGFMQVRHGPNRVGPMGLLQPIADALTFIVSLPFLLAFLKQLDRMDDAEKAKAQS